MKRHLSPIDQRPFQAKSVLELQQALELHYRRVAIPEVAAALHQKRPAAPILAEASAAAKDRAA